jgi:transcriptional regulator with XRE-family HTH domain
MELLFNPMRLKLIRKLRGLTIAEVEERMRTIGGFTNRMSIDRWEGSISPSSFEKAELLAKACEVPVGFFFYNNVTINMENLNVTIFIADTKETVTFNFLENY